MQSFRIYIPKQVSYCWAGVRKSTCDLSLLSVHVREGEHTNKRIKPKHEGMQALSLLFGLLGTPLWSSGAGIPICKLQAPTSRSRPQVSLQHLLRGFAQKGGFQKDVPSFRFLVPSFRFFVPLFRLWGSKEHSPKPPFWKPPFFANPETCSIRLLDFSYRRLCPPERTRVQKTEQRYQELEGGYKKRNDGTKNRYEGTFAKPTLLQKPPFRFLSKSVKTRLGQWR